ncbi:DMT family transporter [Sporosarcina limicola]|uniref:Drug/metabolite transporter (DMT)-like permease n=1 Tax=Sporosarcina limicola TaxID=34101 RepID=A0A927MJZ5_9BACL|nr:EamA family transporter [Sporosarcina limicola]MBE1555775.1 drug/metabolite transporter (DMT)-like permease [Sporosarcina limicola]
MERLKGIIMIITGAILWGATGPMMEWLLETSGMSISFMLIIRLLLAGMALLVVLKIKGERITLPLRQKVWLRQMIIFGLLGMLGVQYAFLGSIQSSSAVIATLFQFLAPIYIIIFVSLKQRACPPSAQVFGMLITIVGLFLLLTNGSLSDFALSNEAVLWGILVGFTFAFYTLYPVRLMQEWGVLLSVGWGMLIGGIALLVINATTFVSELSTLLDWEVAVMFLLVILIGTVAFVLFLGSMKYISPVETSILSSFEPLTAMVISVLWFGQVLGMWQLSGAIIMLVGVTGLSIVGSRVKKE